MHLEICLAKMNASRTPSTVRERIMLSKAGLVEKAIQLFTDASPVECHDRILEHFSNLAATGYEMLLYQRGGFFAIDQPNSARLKDAAGRQCEDFRLRRLQKDLEVEPTAAGSDVLISRISPRNILCFHLAHSFIYFMKMLYL